MKTPNAKSLLIMCTLSVLACSETRPPSQVRDAYLAIDQSPSDAFEQPADSNGAVDSGNAFDAQLADANNPDIEMPLDGRTTDPDSGMVDVDAELVDEGWPVRSCTQTIEYWSQTPNQTIWIAGDFTCDQGGRCWADGARRLETTPEMTKPGQAPCGMGGPCLHTIEFSPADGLIPGDSYSYKLIEGQSPQTGNWFIDPAASRHAFDEDCLNSAFLMPPCDARPSVHVDRFEVDSEARRLTVTLQAFTAIDRTPVSTINLTLNGQPVADSVFNETGQLAVQFDDLPIGKHRLSITIEDESNRVSKVVHLPFWIEAQPFSWLSSPVYMLLVDRFANGNLDNDAPIGMGDVGYSVNWQGGDLQGAQAALDAGYFDALGIKVIWLSPVNQQVDQPMPGRESPRLIAPYHGYWPVEARLVEPRFGGNEALRSFVAAAHSRGIRVLVDLINNQIHEDHVYMQTNPDWFRTSCVCGIDPGCGWSERPLDCLFAPYLPDINWRNPQAREQFIDDALFWVEEFNVDGFRVDAVKHVETMAVYNLRSALTQRFEKGGHRIVMLGETAVSSGDRYNGLCGVQFNNGYEWIDAYTGPNALDGQFDFPSHHRWGSLIDANGSFRDIESAMQAAEQSYVGNQLNVQFLGSHDSGRIISRIAGDAGVYCRYSDACDTALPSVTNNALDYRRLRIIWGLLYAAPGLPMLYYGDEIAMPGGNDPDNRRSLPWQNLNGAEFDMSLTAQQVDHYDFMRRLGRARLENNAFHGLERLPVFVGNNDLAFIRRNGQDWSLVVAQKDVGSTIEIARPNWVADAIDLVSVVGDSQARRTENGWTIEAGETGISYFIPVQAP
ncbi:MAG: hypothetical protein CMH52_12230 [Myxococcales bacterium]|nr:hypothetical protein [Myxococcales bacterium]